MFQQVKFKNTPKTLFSPFKKSIPWYLAYFLVVVYFSTILNAKLVTHFYELTLESKASSYFFSANSTFGGNLLFKHRIFNVQL